MSENQAARDGEHQDAFKKLLNLTAKASLSRDGLIVVLSDLNEALMECERLGQAEGLEPQAWNALDAASTEVIRALGNLEDARVAIAAIPMPDWPTRDYKLDLDGLELEGEDQARDPDDS